MKLYASEDEAYQIRTGHEIVAAYPEIYKPWVIEDIKQNLQRHADIRPDIAGGRSLEDIFAIATYDYWQYGIGTAEEFEQFIGYKPTKEYWWQGKYPSRFENI